MNSVEKILVVYYTQSGQLEEIINNFISPLHAYDLDVVKYSPKVEYPFPWTDKEFWDVMPESVLETPVELSPINYKHDKYDLVILGYQPWYLSPSIPTSSLLQDNDFLKRIRDTPVISVIGSRNMWINSQESIVKRIHSAGGRLIGNVPFIDRSQNQISALTILHWMLTGKKTRKFGIFPKPGVSDDDIAFASEYGDILADAVLNNSIEDIQKSFFAKGEIWIGTDILFIEGKAKRIFKIWSFFIKKFGKPKRKRNLLLLVFKYYLIVALFVIAPIVLSLYFLFVVPLTFRGIAKKKEYLCENYSKW